MKKFKIITFICLILCVAASIAVAADAKFEVSLDRERLALGKISRTLPRNFNALLTTSPHHIFSDVKNLGPFIDRVSEWL